MAVEQAAAFLHQFYDSKAADEYVGLFTITEGTPKRTRFACFRDLDDAAGWALDRNTVHQEHVYFQMGLGLTDLTGQAKRWSKDDIVAMPGLTMDLDVRQPEHKKLNLFETPEKARDFLEQARIVPTFLVWTGGGFHCHQLFDQLKYLERPSDRAEFEAVAEGYYQYALVEARKRGAELDAVWDLARVMRLPGTLNYRYPTPRLCEVQVQTGTWFHYEDFKTFAQPEKRSPGRASQVVPEPVAERTAATGTSASLPTSAQMLAEYDPQFAAVLHRTRGLMPSDSEFDMSIASRMARAGMADQDIAAAIAWSRRSFSRNGQAEKANRIDYIDRTIRKSRGLVEPKSPDPREMLDAVGKELGIVIERVAKYPGDPVTYQVKTPQGEVTLGQSGVLLSYAKFDQQVVTVSDRLLRPVKKDRWREICQILLNCMEVQDLGEDTNDETWLSGKVAEYVHNAEKHHAVLDSGKQGETWALDPQPRVLLHDGSMWIKQDCFVAWLAAQNPSARSQLSRKAWGMAFRAAGLVTGGIMLRQGEQSVRQWFWRVPKGTNHA